MLVLDTSAALAALVGNPHVPELEALLATDADLHVPHLIDVELVHALGRLVLAGHMTPDRAADARADFANLALVRYPHQPLTDRMWELRETLSAYDAAFVALSEVLGAPLVTCDAHLAATPGHEARVELFTASTG
ncbi:MAG TPA: type II toxin-antitoxin system VapC family toxin [Acidimicrobiales bacterium]|nr:type II toxin-antitoxin system VapC family toxin [Acidimicrobiales bacterium]